MGNQQSSDDNPEGPSRFEREARRERWASRIAFAFTVLAFACYFYVLKTDYDESMAAIEACKDDKSWKCLDAAQEAYRKSRQ